MSAGRHVLGALLSFSYRPLRHHEKLLFRLGIWFRRISDTGTDMDNGNDRVYKNRGDLTGGHEPLWTSVLRGIGIRFCANGQYGTCISKCRKRESRNKDQHRTGSIAKAFMTCMGKIDDKTLSDGPFPTNNQIERRSISLSITTQPAFSLYAFRRVS